MPKSGQQPNPGVQRGSWTAEDYYRRAGGHCVGGWELVSDICASYSALRLGGLVSYEEIRHKKILYYADGCLHCHSCQWQSVFAEKVHSTEALLLCSSVSGRWNVAFLWGPLGLGNRYHSFFIWSAVVHVIISPMHQKTNQSKTILKVKIQVK